MKTVKNERIGGISHEEDHCDAIGQQCDSGGEGHRALGEMTEPGILEVLVDNEIAVQNLTKMAQQKGYLSSSEKLAEQEYRVRFTIKDTPAADTAVLGEEKQQAEAETCIPDAAPIRWWPLRPIRWARGPRSWARPCSRPSCSP